MENKDKYIPIYLEFVQIAKKYLAAGEIGAHEHIAKASALIAEEALQYESALDQEKYFALRSQLFGWAQATANEHMTEFKEMKSHETH